MCKEVEVKEGVGEKVKMFREEKDKIFVVADFDRTLTYSFYNGKKIPSLISILRSSDEYLGKEYREKAQELFNKYHPIERSTNLDIEEKARYMERWWKEHYDLLKEKGLTKEMVDKAIMAREVRLREGVKEFIELCYENNIPFIILSSNGLGSYSIKKFLEKEGIREGVYVVSNELEWDEEGKFIGVKEPIVNTSSKYSMDLSKIDGVGEVIEGKKYGIVIGDNKEDAYMGSKNMKEKIAIGYYPYKDEGVEHMSKLYDVLVLEDCDFSPALDILRQIVE